MKPLPISLNEKIFNLTIQKTHQRSSGFGRFVISLGSEKLSQMDKGRDLI
jgi:hypothetical protein